MVTTPSARYSIDEIAQITNLTPRTLRFYEEIGLLPPPDRTGGGHRKYTDADVARVERIRELKELLGYSLEDMKTILKATELLGTIKEEYRRDADPARNLQRVAAAHALLAEQMGVVESRIARLTKVHRDYQEGQRCLAIERDRLQALLAAETGRNEA
jgi:DNA-binding transcriptional MerR regulator